MADIGQLADEFMDIIDEKINDGDGWLSNEIHGLRGEIEILKRRLNRIEQCETCSKEKKCR